MFVSSCLKSNDLHVPYLAIFHYCKASMMSYNLVSVVPMGTVVFQYLRHMKYDSVLFHHDSRLMDGNIILLTFTNDVERKVYAVLLNGAKVTDILLLC